MTVLPEEHHLSLNDMIKAGYSLRKTLEVLKQQDEERMSKDPNLSIFSLTTRLEHWHDYYVYTAEDLARYLDDF